MMDVVDVVPNLTFDDDNGSPLRRVRSLVTQTPRSLRADFTAILAPSRIVFVRQNTLCAADSAVRRSL